jgi:tetratricopeptide (TPR) repeat protein
MRAAGGRRTGIGAACMLVLGMLACAGSALSAPDDGVGRRERALGDLQSSKAEVRAQACEELGETGKAEDLPGLMAALHDSSAEVRRSAEQAIWRIWSRSGDADADRQFAAGLAQMQSGDLRGAVQTFGRVIRAKPDFAEAWNKRATVLFLLGEDDLSLRDCDEVIKRNPRHFGVLAGYGQIHVRKGDLAGALGYFERALAINPNMPGVRDSIDAIKRVLSERQKRFI